MYGACGIIAESIEVADAQVIALRRRFNRPTDFEIHGHTMTERELLSMAQEVLPTVRIVMMLTDKRQLIADLGANVFEQAPQLPVALALPVMDRLLSLSPLRRLWCDVEIPKDRQRLFNQPVQNWSRSRHPRQRLQITHLPSHKKSVVQIADVAAYILQRTARGSFQTADLRVAGAALWHEGKNVIWWGNGDDLQPYL